MKTQPLQSAAELAAARIQHYEADLARCAYASEPFYFVRFRSALLRMTRDYFNSPANFPQAADLPSMTCLAGTDETTNTPNKQAVVVSSTFDASPPGSERAHVYVRIPGIKFEKVYIGDHAGASANRSSQYREKRFTGTAVFMADHPAHDVAVTLLEGLLVFLEGTKRDWIPTVQLTAFDVTDLSEGVEVSKAPQQMLRATMVAQFSGALNINAYEEALPLKRFVVHTNPT